MQVLSRDSPRVDPPHELVGLEFRGHLSPRGVLCGSYPPRHQARGAPNSSAVKIEMMVNAKTTKALGLTVPDKLEGGGR